MTWSIRAASQGEGDILVRHYRAIWRSYGVDDINIRADADDLIRGFIAAGRVNAQLAAFLAESDGKVVGSIACQMQTLPYPDVTVPSFRNYSG